MDASTAEQLKPLLYELAIYGTRQTQPAFDGLHYDDIIKSVSFRLSVHISPRRQNISLYATITPTQGKARTYIILCDATQKETTAIAKRYLARNETPYMWRGVVQAA